MTEQVTSSSVPVRASGEPQKRWTEVLCTKCGGNGVIKIPGGISTCPRCDGRCYEPDHAASASPSDDGAARPQPAEEPDNVFWPPKDEVEEHLYEIRHGKNADYVQGHVGALRELWLSSPSVADSPTSSNVRHQMRKYLDTLTIHGGNIGDIRRSLFMPFDGEWNSWVRDDTAARECLPPSTPAGADQTKNEER